MHKANGDQGSLGLRPICATEPLRARLTGPGGWYNLGNAVGLVAGLGVPVATAQPGAGTRAALDHVAGSPLALALTSATLVFVAGGEAYHRAWRDPHRPDPRLGQLGDLLSAGGALLLVLAAALLGQTVLAFGSGLHAAGKLGSARRVSPPTGWPRGWPDPYRLAVPASRIPTLLGALLAIRVGFTAPDASLEARVIPPVLALCILAWLRADLLLMRSAGTRP